MRELVVFLTLCALTGAVTATQDVQSRMKRSLLFTPAAGMGIYLAVAFPIDLPRYELSMALNVEANYFLPTNATELAYGPQLTEVRKARDLTRGRIYSLIEDRLQSEGFLSRSCLLRTICETSTNNVHTHNGLLGDLLHVIFTPSSTEEEGLPPEYGEAEKLGHGGRENCVKTYPECPVDLYDFFSIWGS